MHTYDHWMSALGPICYILFISDVIMDSVVPELWDFSSSDACICRFTACLLFQYLICCINWSPTTVFITDVLSFICKSFHPSTHSPLIQNSNNWLHTEPLFFCRFQKVSQSLTIKKKTIMSHCSYMMQNDSGVAMLYELLPCSDCSIIKELMTSPLIIIWLSPHTSTKDLVKSISQLYSSLVGSSLFFVFFCRFHLHTGAYLHP